LSTDAGARGGGLIDLLIDDAAVFPPGLAALEDAVPAHRRIRRSALARYVGPFLLPADAHRDLVPLLDDADRLDVVLIGSREDPGIEQLSEALRGLARAAGVRVVGVEVPLPAGQLDPLPLLEMLESAVTVHQSVTIEFDGTDPDAVLAALSAVRRSDELAVRGKFRTGGTTPKASPPVEVLATVIAAATGRHVPVKFTAGLHHAVTGNHGPGGSVQYGVLNLIRAVRRSAGDVDGVPHRRVVDALLADDPDALAAEAVSLSAAEIRAVRSVFTSFGCCGVVEPLAELSALGVIEPHGRLP
jgi:hypothetical protein